MKRNGPLREHLIRLLAWEDAHAGFDAATKRIPFRLFGVRPEGLPYSLWELLEHMRLAQRDILEFCMDPDYQARCWPKDYWPAAQAPANARAVQRSLAGFRSDRRELQRLIADPSLDLISGIPHGEGQTYLREFLLVADHTSFHLGQMVAVRRLLGAWG